MINFLTKTEGIAIIYNPEQKIATQTKWDDVRANTSVTLKRNKMQSKSKTKKTNGEERVARINWRVEKQNVKASRKRQAQKRRNSKLKTNKCIKLNKTMEDVH